MAQANTHQQTFSEGVDAPIGTGTPYTLQVGDTFNGTLTSGDEDWVAVELVAGQTYTFATSGHGSNDVGDTLLGVADNTGALMAFDDDGGAGRYSSITFTPTTSGTYYIAVSGYSSNDTGTYTLSTQTGAPALPVFTDAQIAEQITTGYWGGSTYAWNLGPNDTITVNITGLTSEGQMLATQALQTWSDVSGITFTYVTTGGDIVFDDNQSGAFSDFQSINGTITSATVNVSVNWLAAYGVGLDSYSYQTYVHEIGHALGLGHAGDYNGAADYSDAEYANDSWQASIMSYFSQTDNTYIDASYANVLTPMTADILAIQALYGITDTLRDGDTTYGRGSTAGGIYDQVFVQDGPVTFTIVDDGGVDHINLSNDANDTRIDLNAGGISDIMGLIGNMSIAHGTTIENITTGAGQDTITGNEVANTIRTNAGDDLVNAGDGHDTVFASNGADTLYGNDGEDWLYGMNDDDVLFGEDGRDVLSSGAGNDILYGGLNSDTVLGGAGDDELHGGLGMDTLSGGSGQDLVMGEDGFDLVMGAGGHDTLYGDEGMDTLTGGGGNDILYGGGWADTVLGAGDDDLLFGGVIGDTVSGGSGADTAYGDEGNDLVFGAAGTDILYGGEGPDRLFGGFGADTLYGGEGDDVLAGGDGDDYLIGGAGDDRFTGGAGADQFEFNAGDGIDQISGFEDNIDTLVLDEDLWGGGLTPAQVLATYGTQISPGIVELDFGSGNVVRVVQGQGISLSALEDDITFI